MTLARARITLAAVVAAEHRASELVREKVADAVGVLAIARTLLEEAAAAEDVDKDKNKDNKEVGGRELKLLYEQVVDLHTQAVILSVRIGVPSGAGTSGS